MSDTTYVDYTTPAVNAVWLNEINDHVWHDTPVQGTTVHDAANIKFIQAGIGAVTTTVQNKLRESVSVKDFGAVGDGVTDDRLAIEKAISHLQAIGGGVLYYPTGTYLLNSYSSDTALVSAHSQILPIVSSIHHNMAEAASIVVGNFFDDKSFLVFSGFNAINPVDFTVITDVSFKNIKMSFSGATSRMRTAYQRRIAIEFGKIVDGIVEGCTFHTGDLSNCIGAGYDNTGERLRIAHNLFIDLVQENTVNIDHTSCYIGTRNSIITSNIFRATTTQMRRIGCATEMHNSNIICIGNIIENYTRGVWFVSQEAENTFCFNQAAIGNIANITNAFAYIWVEDGCTVQNILLSANEIVCSHILGDPAIYNGYQGLIGSSKPTSSGNVASVTCSNNNIKIGLTVTAGTATALAFEKPYSQVKIENNSFFGVVDGVKLLDNTRRIVELSIKNNLFVAENPVGRFVSLVCDSIVSSEFTNNTFQFTGTAPVDIFYVAPVGSASNCIIKDNKYLVNSPSYREISFTAGAMPGVNNKYEYIVPGASLNVPATATAAFGLASVTGVPADCCTYGTKIKWLGTAPGEIALSPEAQAHDTTVIRLLYANKLGAPYAGGTISNENVLVSFGD